MFKAGRSTPAPMLQRLSCEAFSFGQGLGRKSALCATRLLCLKDRRGVACRWQRHSHRNLFDSRRQAGLSKDGSLKKIIPKFVLPQPVKIRARAQQRPGVTFGYFKEQDQSRAIAPVGRRAVQGAGVMYRHAAGTSCQGDHIFLVEVGVLGIYRATESAIHVVTQNRSFVRPSNDL